MLMPQETPSEPPPPSSEPPASSEPPESAQTQPSGDVPHPGGFLSYETTRWVRLCLGEAIVVFAFAPGLDRVGVMVAQSGKHIQYREAPHAEVTETFEELQFMGFVAEEIRP